MSNNHTELMKSSFVSSYNKLQNSEPRVSQQQVRLVKDGNQQAIMYQNNTNKFIRQLDEQEYVHLFNKLRPNIEFSLPDRIIQTFVKDGTILPSLKESSRFTPEDFDTITGPLKQELKYITLGDTVGVPKSIRSRLPKKTKKGIKNNQKRNKQQSKAKLLNKLLQSKTKTAVTKTSEKRKTTKTKKKRTGNKRQLNK